MNGSKADCPLCTAPTRDWWEIHYAYQADPTWETVAQASQQRGLLCDAAQARQHYDKHRMVQPPAKGNLRRAVALKRAQELPERLQQMILAVSRSPGLSGTQLAELFYWNGSPDPKKWKSARNHCYRDLKRLWMGDFLYRHYVERASAAPSSQRRARQESMAVYYLGRDAVPLVEVIDGYEPQRGEWINDPQILADNPASVLRDHDAAEVICTLARQTLQLRYENLLLPIDGLDISLSFNTQNWYGARRAAVHFRDPTLPGDHRLSLKPSGLAAIGIDVPDLGRSVLAPFFFEYVTGTKPVEHTAQKLLRYAQLRLANALGERFPDLALDGWLPPLLVICRRAERVGELQEAVDRLISEHELLRQPPIAVVCDEQTLVEHGLTGASWTSLWDVERSPRRYHLVKVLTQWVRPLVGQLSGESVLSFAPEAATRINPGGPSAARALPAVEGP